MIQGITLYVRGFQFKPYCDYWKLKSIIHLEHGTIEVPIVYIRKYH